MPTVPGAPKNTPENIFWGKVLLSGNAEKWHRKARIKQMRWRCIVRLAFAMKRLLDFCGSIFALMLFSPIFLISILAIKRYDNGPIFYKQDRVGEAGRLFTMLKFRTMLLNADGIKEQLLDRNQHAGGITFKLKDDPRITKPGKWLRRFSVDEFPQLINVLRGEMSLVGPRPPVPREVALYGARHLRRLRAKPGLTCLWQIGGRAEIDFEGQVRLDLQYIHSQSLRQDLLILIKTIPAVIIGRGAY